MHDSIDRILISESQIKARVSELASQINSDYEGKKLVLIGLLKGSVPFMADLMRAITLDIEIDFISVSSYGQGRRSSGVVKITKDLDMDIQGKHVLIVEDIVDSGKTLAFIKDLFLRHNPVDLKICTLLDKPEQREVQIAVDYVGFTIPNEFVVGYGLDYAQKHRNLPYVGALRLN